MDDTLQLYFLCAHPSLTPSSAVALTLRAVGGLTTRQIAQAYLVPEATMAQRISRAKSKIKAGGAEFSMPPDDELADGDLIADQDEAIYDGAFHECVFRSAPYFTLHIDGITEAFD